VAEVVKNRVQGVKDSSDLGIEKENYLGITLEPINLESLNLSLEDLVDENTRD